MPNSSLSQYTTSQVSSTAPEKRVLMLYDGAIRFLRSAIKEINQNNNVVAKANLIEKTVKILEYLQSCLDNEKGGEIAVNLYRLYDYMLLRLTEANLKNDTEKMKEVLNLMHTIRDGWNEICEKKDGNNTNHPSNQFDAAMDESVNDPDVTSKHDRKLEIKV